MGLFDFFKKKKTVVEPQKEIKQGFHREREFFPATPLSTPRNEPESWMILEGEYVNNSKVGCWIIKDKSGKEQGYIHYDDYGRKHGLEKLPTGGYTLYYHGQMVKSNLELTNEWKREIRSFKVMQKKGDEKSSTKLKKLLAQGQEKWLNDFSKNFIEER